jgi:hypothetical protein
MRLGQWRPPERRTRLDASHWIPTGASAGICEYPDSKKVGAFAEGLRHMTRRKHHLDYWTDEA